MVSTAKIYLSRKIAKGPAGVAYTCNWIVHDTIGMFNPIIW
jgi:hypothetical protein